MSENDTDDDKDIDCLRECIEYILTSEPVRDPYSTDEDHKDQNISKKNRFLRSDTINASTITIWEMMMYMHIQYSAESGLRSYKEIKSIEDFIANAFSFICPEGVPEFFKLSPNTKSDWNSVAKGIVRRFFEEERFKWIKDNFVVDYSSDERTKMQQSREQRHKLCSLMNSLTGAPYSHIADMHLITRIDDLFMKMKEPKVDQHEAIKGVFYQLLSYVDVPVVYDGEARVDFEYFGVPSRGAKPAVHFIVEPDGILHHYAYESNLLLPYMAIEVYKPNNVLSSTTDKKSIKQFMDINLHSESIHDNESVAYSSNGRTVNNMEIGLKHIHNLQDASQNFYAQLGIDMYGILVQKHKSKLGLSNDHYEVLSQSSKLGCLGIFIMNENVYLAKMTQIKSHLDSKFCDAEFIFAKDFWFNLKKPNDRFGLMIFLHNLLHMRVFQHRLLLQALNEDVDSFPSTIW